MTFVVPFALATGWWIFLIVVVVSVLAIAYGYYTVWGSGISQRPYHDPTGPPQSPSELGHDIAQDVRNWERGTDGGHPRRPPPSVLEPIDPAVAAALDQWRHAPASDPRLAPAVGAADHARGPAGAPTAAIYVDLTSGPCRNALRLLTGFASQRALRVAVRHLPLADVHALALTAAEALEAAADQDEFFSLLDRLAEVGMPDEQALLAAASGCVGDPQRLREEVAAGRHRGRVAEHIRWATSSGARGVPEIYINGERYEGELRVDPLTRALDAVKN